MILQKGMELNIFGTIYPIINIYYDDRSFFSAKLLNNEFIKKKVVALYKFTPIMKALIELLSMTSHHQVRFVSYSLRTDKFWEIRSNTFWVFSFAQRLLTRVKDWLEGLYWKIMYWIEILVMYLSGLQHRIIVSLNRFWNQQHSELISSYQQLLFIHSIKCTVDTCLHKHNLFRSVDYLSARKT